MTATMLDVAIVGAGPYGLSLAAHLNGAKLSYRIFGTPMSSWRNHMPARTLLKSDGFASSLYDPGATFTLADYCRQHALPYSDVGLPVPIETFISYALAFQQRFVPGIEETDVTSIDPITGGYQLTTAAGDTLRAKRVVIATGITHFAHIPPMFAKVPRELLDHSSDHNDVSKFQGRRVAVLGAGASAIDLAGLLHEAGADVHLIARRPAIAFHEPSSGRRSLKDRVLMPRSGLGLGWRSRLCTDAPLLFHSMPRSVRKRAIERHLGPAPGWFAKTRFVGRVTSHLGTRMQEVVCGSDRISLKFLEHDGAERQLEFDHVIAATGYKVGLHRLGFLSPAIRKQIAAPGDVPTLSRNFESSMPNLYFVGLASANSFGPLCRFAYGAKFTSRRLARHLSALA